MENNDNILSGGAQPSDNLTPSVDDIPVSSVNDIPSAQVADIPTVSVDDIPKIPVVQEHPDGAASYTSYVPVSSVSTVPGAVVTHTVPDAGSQQPYSAPIAPTPVYGTEKYPVSTAGVGCSGNNADHSNAVGALVFGIISLLFTPCCGSGFITAIIGLILGFKAKNRGNSESINTVGIVLSFIALILSVIVLAAFLAFSIFAAKKM